MRVIAGRARGRRLSVPPAGTRPTSDRVREALFSSLDSAVGDWSGVRVLDLCAGSGAVGLEALSRGAAAATLVEQDRRCLDVLRRNAAAVDPSAEIIAADARSWLPGERRFDVVYVDPPYAAPDADVHAMLANLIAADAVSSEALVIVERSVRTGDPWPDADWEALRRRDYGETTLWYGRRTGGTGVS